jgi:hypothetical protein
MDGENKWQIWILNPALLASKAYIYGLLSFSPLYLAAKN